MLTQLFDVNLMFYENESGKIMYAMHVTSHDGTSERYVRDGMKKVVDDWLSQFEEA